MANCMEKHVHSQICIMHVAFITLAVFIGTQVNAFIVRKGAPGFRTKKIENKIALRCVQNADMTFEVTEGS